MGFEVKSIGEVCSVGDGAHSKVTRVETGIPYLTSKNIGQGFLKLDKLDYISEESFEKLFSKDSKATRRPQAGDVLFGIIGSFGNTYLYKESDFFGFSSSIGILRPNPELLDSEYLYYVVSSKKFRDNHANHNSGSVQGYTNIPTVKGLPLPVPSIAVQKKIAKVLQSLDRKIAVNQQTNQTLEAMAQAIFKSWFVDFDPVKAKMRGEQPEGMDEATASLFPEKLVESELGLIPEGWEVSSLSELIKLTGGGTPKRSEETYWGGDIPWFSVKDVPSGSNVFVVDTDEKITELGLNKSSTKLLPKGTTIITARGTVGKLALVGTDMCMNQSCYGIRGKEVGDYYNYFNLKQAVSTLQQNTHGAVFDTITTKTFDTYSLAFGGVELADKFDALIAPLLQKIEANVRQNIELSTLRDTLLPKLLSGEIELGQAQELAEVE
ncbi:restriction endonuclease subunit S [Vibrio alginolyticus]|uniref:restriction endonuclease subunit S n=1 Tax=Vibrio alginolyticus TaxID=663 RepID=UPI001BD2AAD7|nr:restriction endonuclease subunit S [Vibrio alginolyticus]MBS9810445.1 restriction endonuclease subunit S [Vibrio alginolyticus]